MPANPTLSDTHGLLEFGQEVSRNVEAEPGIQLPNTGRAGDIDLGEIVADHVEAGKQDAPPAQFGPDLRGDPAVALAQGLPDAGPAGGEVAPGLAGPGYAGEGIGHWIAVEQQDSLIAVRDFRDELLGHTEPISVIGQGLDDDVEIGIPGLYPKDGETPHAAEGLEDDLQVPGEELRQVPVAPRDQGRRTALGELYGEDLFVCVPQAAWVINDPAAPGLGLFEQVGRVDVLHVEGWVLPHQNHRQGVQRTRLLAAKAVPGRRIVPDPDLAHPRPRAIVPHEQVGQLHVLDTPLPSVCGQHHGEGAVLRDLDGPDGVHDDADFSLHPSIPFAHEDFGAMHAARAR